MSEQTFLLSHTPTTEHRISVEGETVGRQKAVLVQQIQFELDTGAVAMLTWFLQAVKVDKTNRHTFTDTHWVLEYDPTLSDLDRFGIMRRATGREITMALSTAYKLLDALTGKTERLVKEQ